jgi:hypothetical protein
VAEAIVKNFLLCMTIKRFGGSHKGWVLRRMVSGKNRTFSISEILNFRVLEHCGQIPAADPALG